MGGLSPITSNSSRHKARLPAADVLEMAKTVQFLAVDLLKNSVKCCEKINNELNRALKFALVTVA